MNLTHKIKEFNLKLDVKLPGINEVELFTEDIIQFLFPIRNKAIDIEKQYQQLCIGFIDLINQLELYSASKVEELQLSFFQKLPTIFDQLVVDAENTLAFDPAAKSLVEVINAYPGFFATAVYRIAHQIHLLKVPYIARIMAEYAHKKTGIDIHPGATIGQAFFIDHGTGVVIGETAEIGNNVKIYQGVTLGAINVSKEYSSTKRHPSIENDVIIYSGATILGGKTTVGKNSIIGGNVWLTKSVLPHSIVLSTFEIKIRNNQTNFQEIDFSI